MKYTSFTFQDYIFTISWLFLLILVAHIIRQKYRDDDRYSYYLPHFYYSLLLGMGMSVFYILQYGGGDTTAYWKGANTLNNVFYENPFNYFGQLLDTPVKGVIPGCYNETTGIPPVWIYYESSSWFVSKIASFFSFFCFESYLALNLLFVVITNAVTWRFFLFVDSMNKIDTRYNAIATLFIPTVCFWCSGLMKDTIVYWSILILVMELFKFLNSRFSWKSFLIVLICIYVIIATRAFILIGILVPYFMIIIFRLNSNKPFITRLITRFVGTGIAIACFTLFMRSSYGLGEFSSDNLLTTAESIHNDFSMNKTYTGKRYDLGLEDFSTTSIVKALPLTLITVFYRPFIWEVESPIMLMNAVEGMVFMYFTLKLFKRRKNRKHEQLEGNSQERDFFWFCILFVLIMSLFVGLTSGLYGVLARLKAPILPFLLLILFSKLDLPNKQTLITSSKNGEE